VPELRPLAAWTEFGAYRLLACGPAAAPRGTVLDSAVVRLRAGDPQLVDTLNAYPGHGDVQQTAPSLDATG
jgi:hypothetical protein